MWKLKALVQFVLAHLPHGEYLNHLAQIANGSFSSESSLRGLLTQAQYLGGLNQRFGLANAVVVEIGPGWQGVGTLALALFGPKRIYAYDHQRHLRLRLLSGLIDTAVKNIEAITKATGIEGAVLRSRLGTFAANPLDTMRVTYVAPGDAASTGLADSSVDLVYSYGVLEHIPPQALASILLETRRILKASGRASHNIGLHDHFHSAGLGNGVNFLRYSERIWNFFCGNAILYHNRLRMPHYMKMFATSGLCVAWQDSALVASDIEALRALVLAPEFRGFSEAELATAHLYVDLVPAKQELPTT